MVHTDLTLPGNDGLDVKIMRVYNSAIWGRVGVDVSNPGLVAVNEKSPLGIGWSMHMGILRNPNGTGSANRFSPDNPVFEMPDGSSHVFYLINQNNKNLFISKNYMILNRTSSSMTTSNCTITLPDGTVYTMVFNLGTAGYYTGYQNTANTSPNMVAQTTQISNATVNSVIKISYAYNSTAGYSDLKTITDSCNRTINFYYNSSTNLLTSISVDNRTYTYSYQTISVTLLGNFSFLQQVGLPVGNPWVYTYNTGSNTYDLSQVKFPAGGTLNYTYNTVSFNTGATTVGFRVVGSRATSTGGTWTYTHSQQSSSYDVTTVNGPGNFKQVYTYYGWNVCPNNSVWQLGQLVSIENFLNGTSIYKETNTWGKSASISSDTVGNANWTGTVGMVYDSGVFVPLKSSCVISRDGKTYTTTYTGYDSYANPGTINETGTGSYTRKTVKTYFYNTTYNIVQDKPLTETITVNGVNDPNSNANSYQYNSDGSVYTATKCGVTTTFGYGSDGNLYSVKDANGKMRYYYWNNGRINKMQTPVYTVNRVINPDGTIASETDGNGHKTGYLYDGDLRLTSITPPVGNPTTYSYNAGGTTITEQRGNFTTTHSTDGFGRPTGTVNSIGATTFTTYTNYDVKYQSGSNTGDTTTYDYFGRPTLIAHQDNTSIGYSYLNGNVVVTDENNGKTTMTYNCFGHPDDKWLTQVTDAAGNNTTYAYNAKKKILSITQGNITRTYGYDGHYFLTSESHPDKGSISYGRDSVGTMMSKTDTLGTVNYTYDNNYRLTNVQYGSNNNQ